MTVPPRQHCGAYTKAGKPCKAWALHDTATCISHSSKEAQQSVGFGGAQPGAGRPARRKPSEILQQIVEENVLLLVAPHLRMLGYDVAIVDGQPEVTERPEGGAKLYGTSKEGDVYVSHHDDLGAQATAGEKLFDRVYGRPKQSTEISGPDGGPVEVLDLSRLSEAELVALAALAEKAAVEPEEAA